MFSFSKAKKKFKIRYKRKDSSKRLSFFCADPEKMFAAAKSVGATRCVLFLSEDFYFYFWCCCSLRGDRFCAARDHFSLGYILEPSMWIDCACALAFFYGREDPVRRIGTPDLALFFSSFSLVRPSLPSSFDWVGNFLDYY